MSQKPLVRFLALVALVWVAAWLPVGLWTGDPDYVLTRVSRDTWQRQFYQVCLYLGLVLVFLDAWRRNAPERPRLGRPTHFAGAALVGLVTALVTRAIFWLVGARVSLMAPFDVSDVPVALVSCLAVGVAEEAVFRGFLLSQMVNRWGWTRGAVICSLLFASVHLFRPGDLAFRLGYGVGLFILAMLLARLAWAYNSILASAGFHSGLIVLNLLDPWEGLSVTWWSGWQQEPLSGVLSWVLTLGLWHSWERFLSAPCVPGPDAESLPSGG